MKTIIPKITLIFKKNGKKVFKYPSVRKMQFFLKNKADRCFKDGSVITIRVVYDDGSSNSGTFDNVDDLRWAFQVFVKEYIE